MMIHGLLSEVHDTTTYVDCLQLGDTFPGGFYDIALCEHCIRTHGITPVQHCPFGVRLPPLFLRARQNLRSPLWLDATKELGVPLLHPLIKQIHCLLHSPLIDTVRVLPTDITTMHLPPVVNVSTHNGRAGERLGVIPVQSIHSAIFRDMCHTPPERKQNVKLEYLHCQCGEW